MSWGFESPRAYYLIPVSPRQSRGCGAFYFWWAHKRAQFLSARSSLEGLLGNSDHRLQGLRALKRRHRIPLAVAANRVWIPILDRRRHVGSTEAILGGFHIEVVAQIL